MILLDAAFRFSGIALLVVLAALAFRPARQSLPHRFLALSCASLTGLFAGYTPAALTLPDILLIPARVLDIPHLVFIWLFALSLFEKDFRVKLWHVAAGVVFCAPIAVARLFQFTPLGPFPLWATALVGVMSFAIAGHMILSVLRGRADDLSAARRRSRVYFAVVIAFVTVAAAAIELVLTGHRILYLPTAKILTIWPAIVWATVWLIQIRPHVFAFDSAGRKRMDDPVLRSDLHGRLKAEMVENRAFLEPGLGIQALAKRLGVTQHALREFINQELGFRNFSDFVNTYRIDAVKDALVDPANRHQSILEIATRHGFNSLSPFNRAFKSQLAMTPREYREQHDGTGA